MSNDHPFYLCSDPACVICARANIVPSRGGAPDIKVISDVPADPNARWGFKQHYVTHKPLDQSLIEAAQSWLNEHPLSTNQVTRPLIEKLLTAYRRSDV